MREEPQQSRGLFGISVAAAAAPKILTDYIAAPGNRSTKVRSSSKWLTNSSTTTCRCSPPRRRVWARARRRPTRRSMA